MNAFICRLSAVLFMLNYLHECMKQKGKHATANENIGSIQGFFFSIKCSS